jgi:hypothetical protein
LQAVALEIIKKHLARSAVGCSGNRQTAQTVALRNLLALRVCVTLPKAS